MDILSLFNQQPQSQMQTLLNMGDANRKISNNDAEYNIINKVADEYNLSPESRKLLFVIRKVENGKQGREFGVLNEQAERYKDDPDWTKSFTTQAQWAAGTIKKRYKGNIEEFANRWAPIGVKNDPKGLNKNWVKNAKFYMESE